MCLSLFLIQLLSCQMAHLDGRMPHREIYEIINDATKARGADDVNDLLKRCSVAAQAVSKLTADFRSSIPAGERKRGSSQVTKRNKNWKPIADTFLKDQELSREIPLQMQDWTLEDWISRPHGGTYDERPSVVISLISRGVEGVEIVRQIIAGGFDLRAYEDLHCHIGGGLYLLSNMIVEYIWFNQLLLNMKEGEIIGKEYLDRPFMPPAWMQGTVQGEIRTAASNALREHVDAYDNRDFRDFPVVAAFAADLRNGVMNATRLREHVKDHIFPVIYRGAYLCLYNEQIRENPKQLNLEDATVPDASMFPLESTIQKSLANTLSKCLPPIQGIKRKEIANHFGRLIF